MTSYYQFSGRHYCDIAASTAFLSTDVYRNRRCVYCALLCMYGVLHEQHLFFNVVDTLHLRCRRCFPLYSCLILLFISAIQRPAWWTSLYLSLSSLRPPPIHRHVDTVAHLYRLLHHDTVDDLRTTPSHFIMFLLFLSFLFLPYFCVTNLCHASFPPICGWCRWWNVLEYFPAALHCHLQKYSHTVARHAQCECHFQFEIRWNRLHSLVGILLIHLIFFQIFLYRYHPSGVDLHSFRLSHAVQKVFLLCIFLLGVLSLSALFLCVLWCSLVLKSSPPRYLLSLCMLLPFMRVAVFGITLHCFEFCFLFFLSCNMFRSAVGVLCTFCPVVPVVNQSLLLLLALLLTSWTVSSASTTVTRSIETVLDIPSSWNVTVLGQI